MNREKKIATKCIKWSFNSVYCVCVCALCTFISCSFNGLTSKKIKFTKNTLVHDWTQNKKQDRELLFMAFEVCIFEWSLCLSCIFQFFFFFLRKTKTATSVTQNNDTYICRLVYMRQFDPLSD